MIVCYISIFSLKDKQMFVGSSVLEVLQRLPSVNKNICRAATHSADIENQKLLKTKNRSQLLLI